MKLFLCMMMALCFCNAGFASDLSSGTLLLESSYKMKDELRKLDAGTFNVEFVKKDDTVLYYNISDTTQSTGTYVELLAASRFNVLSSVFQGRNMSQMDSYTSGVVVFSQLLSLIPINRCYEKSNNGNFANENGCMFTELTHSIKDMDDDHKSIKVHFEIQQTRFPFPPFQFKGTIDCVMRRKPNSDADGENIFYLRKFDADYTNELGKKFLFSVNALNP